MAPHTSLGSLQLPIIASILLLLLSSLSPATGCYSAIFAFGDSMTETGNYLISLGDQFTHVAYPPYGETFFHQPTGRYSDGRIIVDFLAEAFGLPLLSPYLEGLQVGHGFRHGANFAFAGATALDGTFFMDRGMLHVFTNNSLRVQLEWFQQLLPSLCGSKSECNEFLRSALFLVGEIGGNDYNHPLTDGTSFREIETFVPAVTYAIRSTIETLIELGARTLVVPGTFPIGCMPAHLTEFEGVRGIEYEPFTGCIKQFNEFSEYHNSYLQDELNQVRCRNPHATIIYADYYGSTMRLVRSPLQFGFYDTSRSACCGGGGPYNYNPSVDCGCQGSKACDDPSKYIYWDGYHLTEAAYRRITTSLLEGPYAFPPIAHTCPPIVENKDAPQYSY